jgi:hypothetical protein
MEGRVPVSVGLRRRSGLITELESKGEGNHLCTFWNLFDLEYTLKGRLFWSTSPEPFPTTGRRLSRLEILLGRYPYPTTLANKYQSGQATHLSTT